MKVQVYHVWRQFRDEETNEIIPTDDRKVRFEIIGEAIGNDLSAEDIWNLTNWSCWGADENNICAANGNCESVYYKPTKFDKGYTNDDIMFFLHGFWWCAKPFGWHKEEDFASAVKYLSNNAE